MRMDRNQQRVLDQCDLWCDGHRQGDSGPQPYGEHRCSANRNRDDRDADIHGDATGVHTRVHVLDFANESNHRRIRWNRIGQRDGSHRMHVDGGQHGLMGPHHG